MKAADDAVTNMIGTWRDGATCCVPDTLPGPGDELDKTNTQLDYTVSSGMFQVLYSKRRVVQMMKGRSSVHDIRHGGMKLHNP